MHIGSCSLCGGLVTDVSFVRKADGTLLHPHCVSPLVEDHVLGVGEPGEVIATVRPCAPDRMSGGWSAREPETSDEWYGIPEDERRRMTSTGNAYGLTYGDDRVTFTLNKLETDGRNIRATWDLYGDRSVVVDLPSRRGVAIDPGDSIALKVPGFVDPCESFGLHVKITRIITPLGTLDRAFRDGRTVERDGKRLRVVDIRYNVDGSADVHLEGDVAEKYASDGRRVPKRVGGSAPSDVGRFYRLRASGDAARMVAFLNSVEDADKREMFIRYLPDDFRAAVTAKLASDSVRSKFIKGVSGILGGGPTGAKGGVVPGPSHFLGKIRPEYVLPHAKGSGLLPLPDSVLAEAREDLAKERRKFIAQSTSVVIYRSSDGLTEIRVPREDQHLYTVAVDGETIRLTKSKPSE